MAKVKKYAKGGSYYVTVKDPPPTSKKPEPKASPLKGWNVPEINPNK